MNVFLYQKKLALIGRMNTVLKKDLTELVLKEIMVLKDVMHIDGVHMPIKLILELAGLKNRCQQG